MAEDESACPESRAPFRTLNGEERADVLAHLNHMVPVAATSAATDHAAHRNAAPHGR